MRSRGHGVEPTVTALLCVLLAATPLGLLWRWRQGKLRSITSEATLLGVLERLGEAPGERATLLQFSSAFCAPCRATRRILEDIAEAVPGVRHIEVDAESHLDIVRELHILKTPTTLVLDHRGVVTQRAAGQPKKQDVLAALEQAVV